MKAGFWKEFTKKEIALIIAVFGICFAGAMILPLKPCPDEGARQLLSNWIFKTGTLPTGNEPETIIQSYGFSYALRPYLSAIVSALFMKIVSLFTNAPSALMIASRMCSVCSITVCSVFCIKLGHKLFRKKNLPLIFAMFICLMPQVLFLGMYQNNDSIALASVAIILYYFWQGYESHWSYKNCAGLAVGLSIALLSYYTIYAWILMCGILVLISLLRDKELSKAEVLKRLSLIAAICMLLAGWFFIRNAIYHNGDFLGTATEWKIWEAVIANGNKDHTYYSPWKEGVSLITFLTEKEFYWLRITFMSVIGVFGNMDILNPAEMYGIYYAIILAGILGCLMVVLNRKPEGKHRYLMGLMFCSSLATFLLHFIQSYYRDYEPQGRYIISILFFMSYMFAYAMEHLELRLSINGRTDDGNLRNRLFTPDYIFIVIWLALLARSVITMRYML
ncbi:MAG: hypothetical protein K6G64_06935 [Eubacterium sp.]|nr:hypothetical protein [Eubacterium sp.]